MNPEIDPAVTLLLELADDLSQWERAELGRTLRRAGWTYTEIAGAVPAAKSTIAGWCSAIVLSEAQIEAIKTRTGSVRGVPRDTQWRRRQERAAIAEEARREARDRSDDPYWSAGVMLYWGEGLQDGKLPWPGKLGRRLGQILH